MNIVESPVQFELAGPEIFVELKKNVSVAALFSKVLFLSMIRPSTLDDNTCISNLGVVRHHLKPDAQKVLDYKRVCGFSSPDRIDPNQSESTDPVIPIPATYLQTLFIGLLGKFITTSHFPLTPMGLIQVGQSFEQTRAVSTDEILDLSCQLQGMTKTAKGIHTHVLLKVLSGKEIVWQGISTFFTRSKNKPPKKKANERKEECLEIQETIAVPRDTGLKYAGVSGDYNPHHLYGFTARMIGFKQPIAHGMWSLARAMASLENKFGTHYPLKADATFKLPIFMPSVITLGHEPAETLPAASPAMDIKSTETRINFELRDKAKGLPHLKGQFAFNPSE
jgi:acyl dehydratase